MKLSITLLFVGVALGLGVGYWYWGGWIDGTTARIERTVIGRAPLSMRAAEASEAAPGALVAVAPPARDAGYEDKSDYLKVLAAKDPQAAIAWAQANAEERELDDLYEIIAEEWAKTDPRGAFDWAQTLSISAEREDAIIGVMQGILAGGNVELALAFSEELPPGEHRDEATKEIVGHLATKDLDRALTLTATMGETYAMGHAGGAIAEAFIKEGRFDELRQRIEGLPYGSVRQQMMSGMLQELAESDINAALAWVVERPTGPDGDPLFDRSVLQNSSYYLARELVKGGDVDAAFAWAREMPEPGLRGYFEEQIGEAWAQRFPGEAGSWLLNAIDQQGYKGFEMMTEGIFEEWIEVDQNAPFAMIAQIADPETRNWAAFQAINDLAGENPRLAAQRLEEWAGMDSLQAQQSAGRMMNSWLRRDPGEASQWLSERPPGPVKDGGIEQLVHSVLREERDFVAARAWIGEVQDAEVHGRLTKELERYENPEKANRDEGGLMLQNGVRIEVR